MKILLEWYKKMEKLLECNQLHRKVFNEEIAKAQHAYEQRHNKQLEI